MATTTLPLVELHYSTFVLWCTVLSVIIVIAVTILLYFSQLRDLDKATRWSTQAVISYLTIALMWGSLLFLAYISPQSYSIGGEGLKLNTLCSSRLFSSSDYVITPNVSADELAGAVRTFGSGGCFGHLGKYSVKGKGTCNLYLTGQDGQLIRLQNRRTGQYTYITQ